ncbi:MAG: PIN domain-containing protein [Fimbriimonadales bacterium]|nr:MAG: DNA-binding protein [Fimbriimonadales bacterium]
MNGKYLADTSVLVELIRGSLQLAFPPETELIVCVIAVGELYYGALISGRPEHNLQQLKQFLSSYPILHTDESVAAVYAELKRALKQGGTPIPENDLWMAAFATTHQLPLLTRDSHFQHVAKLGVQVIFI